VSVQLREEVSVVELCLARSLLPMAHSVGQATGEANRHADTTRRAKPAVIAEHVLVTTDGSEVANRAIPMALTAARACGSKRLTLMQVLCRSQPSGPVHALEWELARAQVENELRSVAAGFEDFPGVVETVVKEGRPAEQIMRFSETAEVDLLVLASHGADDSRIAPMGSVATKIVASSRNSLLLVPAYAEPRPVERVLVPLDCSARAESVLPLVYKLAEVEQPEFIFVHVVPQPEIPHRLPPGARDHALAEELTRRNRQRAESYLQGLHDRVAARGIQARTEVLVDVNPARTIDHFVQSSDTDLILLSAHGASGHFGEVYGSLTRRLLDSLTKPLWIVQDLPPAPIRPQVPNRQPNCKRS
jgi:nucleotide-binding universal stress UspA family protein